MALAGVSLGWLCSTAAAATSPQIATEAGLIQGSQGQGAAQYLGIPYAAAPVGELRWRAPQPASPWSGVKEATRPGPACPQPVTPFSGGPTDEDCLQLNVYVSENAGAAQSLPVIAWIHPGGLGMGSGRDFDGTRLARDAHAVVVTLNHRLGALGFMRSAETSAEGRGANVGLQDQQLALRWIQRNIAGFGGDPRRVTIAGNSAGAWGVCMHLLSPMSAGLFQRAILQSGACLNTPTRTTVQAQAATDVLAQQLGCPKGVGQLACLRSKPAQAIIDASSDPLDLLRTTYPWAPVIDGVTLPRKLEDMLQDGQVNKVPLLMGTTTDEGRFFVGYSFHMKAGHRTTEAEYQHAAELMAGSAMAGHLTRALYPSSAESGGADIALTKLVTDAGFACPMWADAKRWSKHVPVYAYEFTDAAAPGPVDPFMDWRAYHTAEIQYVFRQPAFVTQVTRDMSPSQVQLSDQMVAYWAAFAAQGEPTAPGLPAWRRFDAATREILQLGTGGIGMQRQGAYEAAHQCGTWSFMFWLSGRL